MHMHRYQISIDYNYVFYEYTCTALNFRSSVITHGKIFLQVLKIGQMVVSEVITIATQTVHNTPDMIIIKKNLFLLYF